MAVKYNVIGLMSGTSMDGLDLVYCQLSEINGKWTYHLLAGETYTYSSDWLAKLNSARNLSSDQLDFLDLEYGALLAEQVTKFLAIPKVQSVDFIASHGHTVHHLPEKGITVQIGSGKVLSKKTGIKVVNDFRTQDVQLGGQGAPLVPVGDQLLFSDYDACLNLGGFSNISFNRNGHRIAFDIGPANIVLNHVSKLIGVDYDAGGEIAKSGNIDLLLLEKLNELAYYQSPIPKSLGVEWVEKHVYPLLKGNNSAILLRTLTAHCTYQIAEVFRLFAIKNVLVTGGGVFNSFFMNELKSQTAVEIVIPSRLEIEFKEALIFAFLGVLRLEGKINVLKSVTGADFNHSSGEIHLP
ncbi:MAG: anhydro-N-acetylmuramic acid kinase [Salibacteraceae bacterium]|jgi:anhydro-N-acetylmuramic acid kinase